jgi:hypothetical protein
MVYFALIGALVHAAPAERPAWKPVVVAGAKPAQAVAIKKGEGNDALIIKMVSVADVNNVWCVANDGKKDAVYQLKATGLEHSFDGVFVAAGHEIVMAINEKQELFELPGGLGSDWTKVEGVHLTSVTRPSKEVGWGILDPENGDPVMFHYNHDTKKWELVKNLAGGPAAGIVDVVANAEDAALAVTDRGELVRFDFGRKELAQRAKALADKKGKKLMPAVKKSSAKAVEVPAVIKALADKVEAKAASVTTPQAEEKKVVRAAKKKAKAEKKAAKVAKKEKKTAQKAKADKAVDADDKDDKVAASDKPVKKPRTTKAKKNKGAKKSSGEASGEEKSAEGEVVIKEEKKAE